MRDVEISTLLRIVPLFLKIITVVNVMLIKSHIETWVWKSIEIKLLMFKVF